MLFSDLSYNDLFQFDVPTDDIRYRWILRKVSNYEYTIFEGSPLYLGEKWQVTSYDFTLTVHIEEYHIPLTEY